MTAQDGYQCAFRGYSRYLDVVERLCNSSEVSVATFSNWLGSGKVCSSLGDVGLSHSACDLSLCVGQALEECEGSRGDLGSDDGSSCSASKCIPVDDAQELDGTLCGSKPQALLGVVDGIRGKNWERNRMWNEKKKQRKLRKRQDKLGSNQGYFSKCEDDIQKQLRDTRAMRLIAENRRATEQAERSLKILSASDVSSVVRKNETKTRAAIERNLISIEKAHSSLTSSGNVPGDLTGFAATIVSSGSISPGSSASSKEFRECQKALLDAEAENRSYRRQLGLPETRDEERERDHADGIFTDNTENRQYCDDNFSTYGIQPGFEFGCEGKFRVVDCGQDFL